MSADRREQEINLTRVFFVLSQSTFLLLLATLGDLVDEYEVRALDLFA